jgi:plasmid stabilization system protein ParE
MIAYRLLPEAERELDHALARYEQKRAGLGSKFLADFAATLQRARRMPHTGTLVQVSARSLVVRRFFLRSFPYKIIAGVGDDMLVVVAVPGQPQHPDYWKPRLTKVRP